MSSCVKLMTTYRPGPGGSIRNLKENAKKRSTTSLWIWHLTAVLKFVNVFFFILNSDQTFSLYYTMEKLLWKLVKPCLFVFKDCWPSLNIQIDVLLWLFIHSMDFLVKKNISVIIVMNFIVDFTWVIKKLWNICIWQLKTIIMLHYDII